MGVSQGGSTGYPKHHALSATQLDKLRRSRPKKTKKHFDGGGLYVEVPPKGRLRWRFKYRFLGKENLISLGTYPEVSLSAARKAHTEARAVLASGRDPSVERKVSRSAQKNTFETIARLWWKEWARGIKNARHVQGNLRRLERHLFPAVGRAPIASLTSARLRVPLDVLVDRGHVETAKRVKIILGQVFKWAMLKGHVESDPTAVLGVGLPPPTVQHRAAILDPARLGEFLLAVDTYESNYPLTRVALRLAPLVFVRPGNLREATWDQLDLEDEEPAWTIPVEKLKRSEVDLIVPLSQQALELFEEAQTHRSSDFVFPSVRSRSRVMSDNTLNAALRRLGFTSDEVCSHGFRATARTLLREKLKVREDLIEHQLAHAVRDSTGRAYNRTSFLDERRQMMQRWADYLDELRERARKKAAAATRPGRKKTNSKATKPASKGKAKAQGKKTTQRR